MTRCKSCIKKFYGLSLSLKMTIDCIFQAASCSYFSYKLNEERVTNTAVVWENHRRTASSWSKFSEIIFFGIQAKRKHKIYPKFTNFFFLSLKKTFFNFNNSNFLVRKNLYSNLIVNLSFSPLCTFYNRPYHNMY